MQRKKKSGAEIKRELLDKQAADIARKLPVPNFPTKLNGRYIITYPPVRPIPYTPDDFQKHADDINQSAEKTRQRLQSDLDALIQANEEAEKQRWQQREKELASLEVDKSKPFLGAADVAYMLRGKRDGES